MHNSFLDGSAGVGPDPYSDKTVDNNAQETNVEDSNGEKGLDYDNEDYDDSSEEEDEK